MVAEGDTAPSATEPLVVRSAYDEVVVRARPGVSAVYYSAGILGFTASAMLVWSTYAGFQTNGDGLADDRKRWETVFVTSLIVAPIAWIVFVLADTKIAVGPAHPLVGWSF